MGISSGPRGQFLEEMENFANKSISDKEYNRRYCLCRGAATTLMFLPSNIVFYKGYLSQDGLDVFRSTEYLSESVPGGASRQYFKTFTANDIGSSYRQVSSEQLDNAILGLDQYEILDIAEHAKKFPSKLKSLNRLLEVKKLTGEEYNAMIGILREMAYIEYQQRCSPQFDEERLIETSPCKLYTKAAFEELTKFKAR